MATLADARQSKIMATAGERVLARLRSVRRNRDGWMARCPAHEDRNPSLSIREAEGKILLHCFAGCAVEAVCSAIGIRFGDLFEKPRATLKPEQMPLHNEADALLAIENRAFVEAQDEVLAVERLRRNSSNRLNAMHAESPERWPGEMELAWSALALAHREMLVAAATYCIVAFGSRRERVRFALNPKARGQMIRDTLWRGYVCDEQGYRFEVQL